MNFTKYSALQNPLTNNKEIYLRDYSYITLYNKSGKSQFIHEHFIFISNYFIKKLRQALHIYIDGTFLYPPAFFQLIVILYRDESSGLRYPGLYALINKKKRSRIYIPFRKKRDYTKKIKIGKKKFIVFLEIKFKRELD